MSVRFVDVTKRYGATTAVAKINFIVETGTLVTLLGPSGCGKTTTLRMIAGLELPSEGRIEIAGRDVTTLVASQRDVSMVFQSYALFPHMSVIENVAYGLRRSGLAKAEATQRAVDGLAQVGLTDYGHRQPSELSGGQQQRVAVARALVLEPSVMLFDEPLSNLDARLRRQMREEIRDLQQRLGLTVVYVTHDQQEAMAVSDRIIVMNAGRIEQEGSPRDLYERPATPFLVRFMGESNLVHGLAQRVSPDEVRIQLGEIEISVGNRVAKDGEITVAVRPESVIVETTPGLDGTLAGTIAKASYLGTHMEYSIDTAAGILFVTCPKVGRPLAAGAKVALLLRPAEVTIVAPGQSPW
jgi:iron(III) transport system ATP-binding protein